MNESRRRLGASFSNGRHAMTILAAGVVLNLLYAGSALANGGPFVIKHPSGDPAAKGVLARIDPSLMPADEKRLEVIREDLTITFAHPFYASRDRVGHPLLHVVAEYHIENPTKEKLSIDFGFPIVRGIYISPFSMSVRPAVSVRVDGDHVQTNLISNSSIYGVIRKQARGTIDKGVSADKTLREIVQRIRAEPSRHEKHHAEAALKKHLVKAKGWSERDANLMVAYVSLDIGDESAWARDSSHFWIQDEELNDLVRQNMGVLSAIGEKKATQLLAQLAGRFDPAANNGYQELFAAWGGDVRERSVDFRTGKVRPRENKKTGVEDAEETIYARVRYLDDTREVTDDQRKHLKAILKNLPVIFTFSPMNLLHYQVTFKPGEKRIVKVAYSQYAYEDSRKPKSYQLSYVVHPASNWERFGPIHLTVEAPKNASVRASVPLKKGGKVKVEGNHVKLPYVSYEAIIRDKTGELFVGVRAKDWERTVAASK